MSVHLRELDCSSADRELLGSLSLTGNPHGFYVLPNINLLVFISHHQVLIKQRFPSVLEGVEPTLPMYLVDPHQQNLSNPAQTLLVLEIEDEGGDHLLLCLARSHVLLELILEHRHVLVSGCEHREEDF